MKQGKARPFLQERKPIVLIHNTTNIARTDVTLSFEMTFFFNGGHRKQLFLFTESWDLVGTSPLSPAQRHSMIAEARLPLLVPRASIVKYKLTGQPLQPFNRPGTATGSVMFPFKACIEKLRLLHSQDIAGRSKRVENASRGCCTA